MAPQSVSDGWQKWHAADVPLRLGVSSCLLGEEVRFDGGHARDRFVSDVLGRWVEWVPVCPEMEIGMGAPRPTIRLVDVDGDVRLVAPSTQEDFTDRMRAFSESRTAELEQLGLDGYVLKKGSPSCAMERIKVYRNAMPMHKQGVGLFAQALMARCQALPIEEEGRLNDPVLRENFIERVFCSNRWRVLVRSGLTRTRLIEFHTAHKMLLRAHNEAGYQRLGRLVGSAGTLDDQQLFNSYGDEFHKTLRWKTTVKRHTNVLQHALGYLKDQLSGREKAEILTAIDDYRGGLLPLIVPLTLLRYNVRNHEIDYLRDQLYFDPHPKELMLRNHV